ncbi:MAG: hypothetical protein WEB60_10315 [Terrimicrobiaceae bacterium]
MNRWIKASAILLVVWGIAAGVILYSRAARPTAESLSAYLDNNSLAGLPESKRAGVIAKVAGQLNRLDFEERQELRKLRTERTFFEQMTDAERRDFLEQTLPEGFRQMMLALNKMSPEERKKIVNRVLDDIERDSPEIAERIDNTDAQKVISEGLGSFYEEASAEVKMDFAPVIERLQRATQGMR